MNGNREDGSGAIGILRIRAVYMGVLKITGMCIEILRMTGM